MFIVISPMHLWLGYCFWYQLFFVSGMWCWFLLEYTWFWVGFVILAWIHLIQSWFCDFALNTLDSELVLCLHLIYKNARYYFWYQLYYLWHYKKYHVSIWQLFLAKFAAKMHYVWQGVVVAISQRKRSKNASRYVCHDTYIVTFQHFTYAIQLRWSHMVS